MIKRMVMTLTDLESNDVSKFTGKMSSVRAGGYRLQNKKSTVASWLRVRMWCRSGGRLLQKLPKLSVPRFPFLQNRGENNTYFMDFYEA